VCLHEPPGGTLIHQPLWRAKGKMGSLLSLLASSLKSDLPPPPAARACAPSLTRPGVAIGKVPDKYLPQQTPPLPTNRAKPLTSLCGVRKERRGHCCHCWHSP
jgi:hypothetical protein